MALQKIGFDYFPVSVDLANDPRVHYLLELAGAKGVGIWTLLLTDIYRSGGWIRWGDVEGRMFARRFGLVQDDVDATVEALALAKIFSPRLLKLGYLSSREIQNRIRDICASSRRKPQVFPQDVEITEEDTSLLGNTENEIKSKQSKVNKSTPHNAEQLQHNVAITPHNTEGSLATAQAPAPKKPKTVVSPTEGKIQHGKYVWLSQEELERFETQHGPEFIKRCIDKLDAWIETDPIPKKIKNGRNAGACFRSWVFNSVSEEFAKRSTAKQGQLGFKPHTAASTVEKNEQYLKERYGQDFVDNMFTIAGFGQEGLDIEPDGGVGVALLPERTTK